MCILLFIDSLSGMVDLVSFAKPRQTGFLSETRFGPEKRRARLHVLKEYQLPPTPLNLSRQPLAAYSEVLGMPGYGA